MATSSSRRLEAVRDRDAILWIVAIAVFGVLDVAITAYAVERGIASEAHPVVALAIEELGHVPALLSVWKAAVLAVFVAIYRLAPREYRLGVPLGLALLGTIVLLNNVIAVV